MTLEIKSSGEARQNWRELLDRVYTREADFLIERNGKAVAVLIPAEDYEGLREALEELRIARSANAAYLEYQADPTSGKPYTQVREELVEEGLLDE